MFSARGSHIALIAIVYVVSASVGQVFAISPGNVTPVWIPSGIILAAVLLRGNYLWPGIFIGAFLSNVWAYCDFSTLDSVLRSMVAATSNGCGDSLCAIIGAYFIRRMTGSVYPFSNAEDVFYFVLFGAVIGSAISAVMGVTGLALMGLIQWSEFVIVGSAWWVGSCVGVLLIAPVFLSISHWKNWRWFTVQSGCELLVFFVLLLLLSLLVVEDNIISVSISLPIILLLPLLIWPVFRFPNHVTFLTIIVISVQVFIAKAQLFGVNVPEIINVSIVEIQLFIFVFSVTVLTLLANKKSKDQIEASLAVANKYNRTLFDELPVGLALCDMEGRLIDVNNAYASIVGRDVEEIKSLSYWDITPEKYASDEAVQIQNLKDNGFYGPYEKEYIHKSGHLVPVELQGRIIVLDGERFIWSTAEDLSEEKRVKKESITTENRYRALFDSAAEAVIITDKNGIISGVNSSAEILFGYSNGDIVGRNVSVLVSESSEKIHDGYIRDFHSTGKSKIIGIGREVEGRRKNGGLIPLHISIGQYCEADNVSYMAVAHDLSYEKKHYESLKRATEEAVRANSAKSEFLSSMSHELRTPLNAIIGFSQVLEMGKEPLSKDQLVSVNEIQRGGKHLLALINEILNLSKIESGKITINMRDVNLTRIIEECLRLTSSQAQDQNVVIKVADNTDFTLTCDPLRLKQILINYLSNGIKYNRSPGTVTVSFKKVKHQTTGKECLRITVSDTGHGLCEKNIASLFTPFERVGAEKGQVQGTGIGLAISKKLAVLMGGDVGVNSILDEGSDFWVDILLAEKYLTKNVAKGKEGSANVFSVDSEGGSQSLVGMAKVLYIEDNEGNTLFIKQAFKLYSESYSLQTCSNPHQGLALAIKDPPDLILLDIFMPGMDGYELLKHLKQDRATRQVLVIAISAKAMECDIEKGLAAGFDGYLCKPVNISTLINTMDGVLGGKSVH